MGLVIFTEDKAHVLQLYPPLPNTHTHAHARTRKLTHAGLSKHTGCSAGLVGEWLVVQDSRGQAAHLVSIAHLLGARTTH